MATANQTTAGKAEPKAKANPVKGLRVIGRTEGFRRAGRAFGADPIEVPLSELSDAQIKQLKNERELVVVDCEIEAPAQADETAE